MRVDPKSKTLSDRIGIRYHKDTDAADNNGEPRDKGEISHKKLADHLSEPSKIYPLINLYQRKNKTPARSL